LNRREIRRLAEEVNVKRNVLVPLSFYWKNGLVKVVLAIGKVKVNADKREDIKEREAERALKRATMIRVKEGGRG
jgi:SsrA-binding protein